jgi:transglutaminase-like putative cysteine protease
MIDQYQSVRVLQHDSDSYILEVTYRPYISNPARVDPETSSSDLAIYLRSTITENWDYNMRDDIIDELQKAGIDIRSLSSREIVERVSKWALARTRASPTFAIWSIYYPNGVPSVYPPLQTTIAELYAASTEQILGHEVVGKSMYYNRVRGSCTSTSIYLSTILRALGIPTRILVATPPFDPNSQSQADAFYRNISDEHIKEAVKSALSNKSGFVNHVFNEVFIEGSWIRLDYTKLEPGIVDSNSLGLTTHIYTCASLSDAPLAETWGMRYFTYSGKSSTRFSSVNPYRLISIRECFGDSPGR